MAMENREPTFVPTGTHGPDFSEDEPLQGHKGGAAQGAVPEEYPTNSVDAPEEASQSEIPGDPRPQHAVQPPSKIGY